MIHSLSESSLRELADGAAEAELRRRQEAHAEAQARKAEADRQLRNQQKVARLCRRCLDRVGKYTGSRTKEQRVNLSEAVRDCCRGIPILDGDGEDRLAQLAQEELHRREQARRQRAHQPAYQAQENGIINVPIIGGVRERDLWIAVALLVGAALLGSGVGTTTSSSELEEAASEADDRSSFMATCLSELSGDMEQCARIWKNTR